jgi:hypothetical protein
MTREELLAIGPEKISPPAQADGTPSFGVQRGNIERALAGDAPSFEWLHRDALGHDIPCEVRLVRLPSSGRRLIRGSITDITERKRTELLAAGDRRVFERITSHADLTATLEAITETAEQVTPDGLCTVSLYEAEANTLQHVAGMRLPPVYLQAKRCVEIGPRNGSCAAAVFLQRQVVVAEIARDALWEHLRPPAVAAGLRACWSTPIRASDGRILGTVALYFHQPRSPLRRDFELMSRLTALAAIAIERKRSEEALRHSEQQYRSLFENVMEGVYRSNVSGRCSRISSRYGAPFPRNCADSCAARSPRSGRSWRSGDATASSTASWPTNTRRPSRRSPGPSTLRRRRSSGTSARTTAARRGLPSSIRTAFRCRPSLIRHSCSDQGRRKFRERTQEKLSLRRIMRSTACHAAQEIRGLK